MGVHGLFENYSGVEEHIQKIYPGVSIDLLSRLQSVHDGGETYWESGFEDVARRFNLTIPRE